METSEQNQMEYNFLGKSGLKVSNICLGTSTFGPQQHSNCAPRPASDDETAMKLLSKFVEKGGNFIDCADMYSLGDAETVVGKWMSSQPAGTRERLVINTKVGTPIDKSNPNSNGLGRKHVMYSIDNSLKNLQTSYVDMYMIHYWDPATPIEDTMRTFSDLVRSGKVRHVGVSNFAGYQLQKCVDCCKYMGLEPVINIQAEYNLLVRSLELEVFEVCRAEHITLTPWGALRGGWLTDKFKKGSTAPTEGSRIAWSTNLGINTMIAPKWDLYGSDEKYWNLREVLGDIAKKHNKNVAQVSLRWCLQKDIIPSVVIGARTVEQLEDNMGASAGWELTQDEMNALDTASSVPLPPTYRACRLYGAVRKLPTFT